MKRTIFLLIAICLLAVGACNCRPLPGSKVESQIGACVKIDAVQNLGSVDLYNFLLKIDGSIQDNQLDGANKIIVFVLKDNVEVEDAAYNLLSSTEVQMAEGKISYLADNQGIAYYSTTIPKQYQGPLSIAMRLPKSSLDPMQVYKAYLLVTNDISAEWIAYSAEGKKLPIAIADDDTTIAMGSVAAIIDDTKPNSPIEFSLQAAILHKKHKLQGGFLLTKQEYNIELIQAMLGKLIQERQELIAETALQALKSYPDVFIASNIKEDFVESLGHSVMSLTDYDTAYQLEGGATYQVYAYVFDEQKNYIVSPQPKALVMPQFEVVLDMQEVTITNLLASMTDFSIQDLKFQLQIDIIQRVGTKNPYVGFLFMQGMEVDQKAALETLRHSLCGMLTTGAFQHENGDIIYIANQLAAEQTGEIKFNITATKGNFILGESYMVYCWLYCDNGIFMSKKPMQLPLPAVKIQLNSIESSYNLIAHEPVQINIQHEALELKNLGSMGAKTEIYYLFNLCCHDTNNEIVLQPTVETFQSILDKAKKQDELERKNTIIGSEASKPTKHSSQFSFQESESNYVIGLGKEIVNKNNKQQLCILSKTYAPFKERSKYALYISFRIGNALFYSDPFPTILETYQDAPQDLRASVIPDPDGKPDVSYEVKILDHVEIWYFNRTSEIKKMLHKENPLDAELVRKLLPLVIKYPNEADQKEAEVAFLKRWV